MRSIKVILIVLLFSQYVTVQAQLEPTIDSIMSAKYAKEGPGATILIAKEGEILFKEAYGMANLELQVPMQPENVFEIGSITKQFTSVAILMLMEEGKLGLQDDIRKYIPDYPRGKEAITIHHLLNHTSGIKSYTEIESFFARAREDMEPLELIDVFKNEEMDFQPGEQYHYNNSAYILLGYIIESVSGMSYADFVESRIFKKLGMNNSYYGSHSEVIKNRASGYQPSESGYRNADYLSLTLPYAAGSIMSCVDDMLLWQQALHNNALISEESKTLAFTNYTLNNGKPIHYGYGFSVDEIKGISTIEHGGGIFGYESYGVYAPAEDVYVIVLSNSNGNSPTDATIKIAAHVLGKPFPSNRATDIPSKDLEKWVGTYEFDNGVTRFITLVDGALHSQREGSQNLRLYPVSSNEFYFEGSFSNYRFEEEDGRKVAHFESRIRKAKGLFSNRKPPMVKEGINVPEDVVKRYVGTYIMRPGFELVITSEGNQIFAQATGQPQLEIFAETETVFFLRVVDATIEFKANNDGSFNTAVLRQGDMEMQGTKVK